MIKQEKLSELTQTDFKWFDVVDIDETDIRELKKSFKPGQLSSVKLLIFHIQKDQQKR